MAEFKSQPKSAEVRNSSSHLPAILMIAFVSVAGSLWLSIGMGLKACPLCLYQRSFVMGVLAVLLMGMGIKGRREQLVVLALPLAVAALCLAAFHVYLASSGKLECPAGILSFGTAPQQSLAILLVLVTAMIVQGLKEERTGGGSIGALAGGLILGCLMAYGSVASAPPLPKAPTSAYETPLDTCRPPFQNSERLEI